MRHPDRKSFSHDRHMLHTGRTTAPAPLCARHHQIEHGPGTPAFLQAATRAAVRLYQRHGYALTTPFR